MSTPTGESLIPPPASLAGAQPRPLLEEFLMKITDLFRRYARAYAEAATTGMLPGAEPTRFRTLQGAIRANSEPR